MFANINIVVFVKACAISAKKNICVTSQLPEGEKSVFVWDTRTGAPVENLLQFDVSDVPVSCIKFSHDSFCITNPGDYFHKSHVFVNYLRF
jgi:hypothetical protein